MVLFFWPKHLPFEYFSICLKNFHPAIKYTFEKAKLIQSNHSQPYQVLSYLDIEIILHNFFNTIFFDTCYNTVETDIYYKDTNAHDYLPYNSAHPKHFKNNFPYNLAKRIFVLRTFSYYVRNYGGKEGPLK